MKCDYCYAPAANKRMDMTAEIAEKAVMLASSFSPANTGIIFFGGEPLMKKDLIRHTVNFCREYEKETGTDFHFKITTNGLLMDQEFLEWARGNRVMLALSIDGVQESHDRHRKSIRGNGTFSKIADKIDLMLSYQPYAYAFMTITPETVRNYKDSVQFLFESGFRYIIASLDYSGAWNQESLKELASQYRKLGVLYEGLILKEEKIYFSPFEKKLASHIQGKDTLCQQCHLGVKQISIAPDGRIYPCVQFVQDGISNGDFSMGDVWKGIDRDKQQKLFTLSQQINKKCRECALDDRCEHRCSCLNWQTTGTIDGISPILCESERILIPIADQLGERLYKKKAPLFIQKHYNAVYPLLSYLEDKGF